MLRRSPWTLNRIEGNQYQILIHVDVQRKKVVNIVDMPTLWAPRQNCPYKNQHTEHTSQEHVQHLMATYISKEKTIFVRAP